MYSCLHRRGSAWQRFLAGGSQTCCICKCTSIGRVQLKCDGTSTETRFRLSAKSTSPFKSAGASVQSTASSRVVRISGSNAGYNMFRGSVKSTGYPLHSPVSPFTSPPVRHRVPSGFKRTLLERHIPSMPTFYLVIKSKSESHIPTLV